MTLGFEHGIMAAESRMLGFRRWKELPPSSDGKVVHRETEVSTGKHRVTVWLVEYSYEDGPPELHRQSDAIGSRDWADRSRPLSRHLLSHHRL